MNCFILVLFTSILTAYSQPNNSNCSGQFTITYPTGTSTTTKTINNGTGTLDGVYCPTDAATPALVVNPASGGTLTLKRVIDGDTTTLSVISPSVAGMTYTFPLPPIAQEATYVLASQIACQNTKLKLFSLTLAPTLSVIASANGAALANNGAVCPNTAVRLTASGATAGTIYTLSSNGQALDSNTTGVFDVRPAVSTVYTVTTTTPNCDNTPVTQAVRVAVNNLNLASNDADNNVASGAQTLLTTSGGTQPYTYTANDGITTTTLTGTGPGLNVTTTRTTLYTVSGTTSAGSCSGSSSLTITVNKQPLPVELMAFAVNWNGQAVQLTWATASETNNAYFLIERSLDGRTFQTVGQQAGAGTSTAQIAYRFSDTNVPRGTQGMVYYRLQQVDENRQTHTSAVRTVQVTGSARAFTASVFPNPFDHMATVQLDTFGPGTVTFRVLDVLGHTLSTTTLPTTTGIQRFELPTTALLPAGLYYLRAEQGKQKQVIKLIKQ
ncbi:T9SS type A sorting domain-containing protein [Hymenobacter busanensis]|uniref:T9SS type A sorting domain-containing protein n=1 Tax=Hymenobacter busanensis TaxID=2607656 RepID=UPI001367485E|nr:T9SS type A sorting domain-containing protein [Hymenobacter busanensis]QHJ09412.1 T9SS type A sorting domain-containing protein [Hymenobacter busanensis]